MEEIQKQTKMKTFNVDAVHGLFKLIAAYVCGGIMMSMVYGPEFRENTSTIKKLTTAVLHMDSVQRSWVKYRDTATQERHEHEKETREIYKLVKPKK